MRLNKWKNVLFCVHIINSFHVLLNIYKIYDSLLENNTFLKFQFIPLQ